MTYTFHNAVFVTMMYQSRVALKPGEVHCPYCDGYAIRPICGERGCHKDCTHCNKKGKIGK